MAAQLSSSLIFFFSLLETFNKFSFCDALYSPFPLSSSQLSNEAFQFITSTRVSLNQKSLESVPDLKPGVSIWGGEVAFTKNSVPSFIENSTAYLSSGLAAPVGSTLRISCGLPPCDVFVVVVNNLCSDSISIRTSMKPEVEEVIEPFYRQLLGERAPKNGRGQGETWHLLSEGLVLEATMLGSKVVLPIAHRKMSHHTISFSLKSSFSRLIVFLRKTSQRPTTLPSITRNSFPSSSIPCSLCPGLPSIPIENIFSEEVARVVKLERVYLDSTTEVIDDNIEFFLGNASLSNKAKLDFNKLTGLVNLNTSTHNFGPISANASAIPFLSFYQQVSSPLNSTGLGLIFGVVGKNSAPTKATTFPLVDVAIAGLPISALPSSKKPSPLKVAYVSPGVSVEGANIALVGANGNKVSMVGIGIDITCGEGGIVFDLFIDVKMPNTDNIHLGSPLGAKVVGEYKHLRVTVGCL